jgi:hypothetical protein
VGRRPLANSLTPVAGDADAAKTGFQPGALPRRQCD